MGGELSVIIKRETPLAISLESVYIYTWYILIYNSHFCLTVFYVLPFFGGIIIINTIIIRADLCVFPMNVYQSEGVDSGVVLGEFKIYMLLFSYFLHLF